MLLFDQNLSPRLVSRLRDIYPGSEHVQSVGLDRATDREVWEYAKAKGLTLVSKDADFNELSLLEGFPPRVVWLRQGNCTTSDIEEILRNHQEDLAAFHMDDTKGTIILY